MKGSKVVLFGVTDAQSIKLLGRIPEFLADRGNQVHLVSNGRVPIRLTHPEITHHVIPMVRNPSLLQDSKCLVAWIRLLHKTKPDAVCVGTPKAGLLGLLGAWIIGVKVRIYHLRGLRLETTSGLARFLLRISESLSANLSTQILAVSPSLKQEFCSLGLSRPEKVSIIGTGSSHGINLSTFSPQRLGSRAEVAREVNLPIPLDRLVIGYVGRLHKDKGSDCLGEISRELLSRNIAHVVLIVGAIEDIAAERELKLALGKRLIWAGEHDEVGQLYHLMDVLVLPTKREGFPNVALEAAASGVPVITTLATGARDSVVDGKTGFLVEGCDALEFATKISRLNEDRRLWAQMSEAGREWAEKFDDLHFSKLFDAFLSSKI